MLWLARDCIRTSRLEEAENLLRRYGRRNSYDYRAPCGLAFVKIEKENYITAADFLTDALALRVGNVQRAYLLILLSRVSEFITSSSGEEKLREALALEPFCPEAMFELIIRYFRGRREADAASRLIRLIRTYKEYYPAAPFLRTWRGLTKRSPLNSRSFSSKPRVRRTRQWKRLTKT